MYFYMCECVCTLEKIIFLKIGWWFVRFKSAFYYSYYYLRFLHLIMKILKLLDYYIKKADIRNKKYEEKSLNYIFKKCYFIIFFSLLIQRHQNLNKKIFSSFCHWLSFCHRNSLPVARIIEKETVKSKL